MTYQRPVILRETIKALFAQSCPPARILIVDNDPEQSAKSITESFSNFDVGYYAVGYNSGPAGAAYHGCKLLYEEGWEWVLWVDDDDPPRFEDQIGQLLKIVSGYPDPEKIGMLGCVGVHFDFKSAVTARIPNPHSAVIHKVDMVAGGQFPLIHKRVFERDIFPVKDLFFGFEELVFGLEIRKAGLQILISGEELARHRTYSNRTDYKRPALVKKQVSSLWREYYSIRSLMYLLKRHKAYQGIFRLAVKSLAKGFLLMFSTFPKGFSFFRFYWHGILDGWKGRLGMRYLPQKKH